jgi:hypothetical protein
VYPQIAIPKRNVLHTRYSRASRFQGMCISSEKLFLLLQCRPSIHFHPSSHNSIANRASVANIDEGDVEGEKWEEDPEHVEEDEVHPEKHEVASVEVLVHREPFRSEGHKACSNLRQRASHKSKSRESPLQTNGTIRGDLPPYNSPVAKTIIQKLTMKSLF